MYSSFLRCQVYFTDLEKLCYVINLLLYMKTFKMLNITKAEKSRTALCSVRELNKGMKERATLGPYVMIYSQFSRPTLPISS